MKQYRRTDSAICRGIEMAVLLLVCLILVPLLTGSGILSVIYGRKKEHFSLTEGLLMGEIAVIGTAEAVHLSGVFLGFSFTVCTAAFCGLTVLLCLAALAALFLSRFPVQRDKSPLSGLSAIFLVLVLSQAVYLIWGGNIYRQGDMTVETVVSFLQTDAFYQINPLTGGAYEGGVPLRLEILCLPTFYGMLSKLFGLEPGIVVWTVAPLATLLLSYSAFYCLAKCVFPAGAKKRECFMVAVALLLWAGGYLLSVDGFGVLYSGWRGVILRNVVLFPYLFSLCLRKRWMPALLCIAAEACIVWTLYGAGACLLAVAVLALLEVVGKYVKNF